MRLLLEAWRRRLWSKRPFWAPCSARSRTTKQRRGGKSIEALATKFEPEKFRDQYREQAEALIAAKIQGREVASGQAHSTPTAPVADIMEALKKSLAAARKPVGRADEVSAGARSERRTPKRQVRKR